MKKAKTETYDEFLSRMTGTSLMSLGRGDSLRDIVSTIIMFTLQWNVDNVKSEKK